MTAAETGATMAADRVDFVDEDDAGRVLLRLLEHVAHARSADADEHFDEVGTRDGEERHLRLTGDGAGQQRLAGTRRADHQHALRNLAAQLLELARVLEEVDDLAHFLLGFVDTGHVSEGDVDLVLAQEPCPTLAEAHGPAATRCALHLPQHVDEHEDQQQRRSELEQKLTDEIRRLRRLADDVHVRLVERADQRRVVRLGVVRLELGGVLARARR